MGKKYQQGGVGGVLFALIVMLSSSARFSKKCFIFCGEKLAKPTNRTKKGKYSTIDSWICVGTRAVWIGIAS
jgi:hypothetical protein